MGSRGPTPRPAALKKLQGTFRPDRDEETGAGLPDNMPRCPTFLSDTARAEWRRLASQLHEAGILKNVDRAALAAFCDSYGRFADLTAALVNEPLTFTTQTGYQSPNPKVKMAATAKSDMLKWASQLGLTPSARGRIVLDGNKKPKEKTLADQLFDIVNGE